MARRWNDAAGWLLLTAAAVLHRWVASDTANGRWLSRRDRALRAARRRGVPIPELAAGLGLSEGWIRQRLNGKQTPVAEEAA